MTPPPVSDTPTSQAGFLVNAAGIHSAFLQPALKEPQRSHPPEDGGGSRPPRLWPPQHRGPAGADAGRAPAAAAAPKPLGQPRRHVHCAGGVGAGSIQLPAAAGSAPPSSAGSYHSCSPAFSLTEDCEWVSRSIHFLYSLCSVYLFLFFAGC